MYGSHDFKQRGKVMSPKKYFLSGMCCGLFVALIISILYSRYPLLTDDATKGSYAYGQQMGKNLSRHLIEFDPRVVAAGMRDAKSDSSRLSQDQLLQGMNYLHSTSAEKRKAMAPPAVVPPER